MVFCCVLGCKSHSEQCDKSVTFHLFPYKPDIRDIWIKFTGRQNWIPSNDAQICSKHFNDGIIRNGRLYCDSFPVLHGPANYRAQKVRKTQPTQINQLHVTGPTELPQPTQINQLPVTPAVMNDQEWNVNRLEKFAAVYTQHEILYVKRAAKDDDHPDYQRLNKEFALERLAGALGLPNDHALHERCREFRFQLLCYVRGRVRACALRGAPFAAALGDAPPRTAQLARALDLLDVALQIELSIRHSPVARWALQSLVQALSLAARLSCSGGAALRALCPSALAGAAAAVYPHAAPVPQGLWCRLYKLRKRQLLKLYLLGDREDRMPEPERLRPADWHLADTLLMYGGDDLMVGSEFWRVLEPFRALTILVELLASRWMSRASFDDRRVEFWGGVHDAYTATGRSATVVMLQRRWRRLLAMAREATPPQHPLLMLVAVSFPRLMQREGLSWSELVDRGLVVTAEVIANNDESVFPKSNISLKLLSRLEKCNRVDSVMAYIEYKLQHKHNLYYNGHMWKKLKNIPDVVDVANWIGYADSIADFDLHNYNSEKVTERAPSVSSEESVYENPINVVETIKIESDSEVVNDEECQSPINCPSDAENEIDMSTTADYVSDIRTEVETLKTMDDIEKTLDDLENLQTFKISKVPETHLISYVDDDGIKFHIKTTKSGKLIFKSPLVVTVDPKLTSIPRVKLKRIEESQNLRRKIPRLSIATNEDSVQPVPRIQSHEVTFISDSSESDDEIDADRYTRVKGLNTNIKSKRMSKRFWRNKNNRRLLKLCKPAVVRLTKLLEIEIPRTGRVVKRVELADIEEVRRINKNILTAQVEPTYVQPKIIVVGNNEGEELQLKDLVRASLVQEVQRIDEEMLALFAKSSKKIGDMIIASIYDDEAASPETRAYYGRKCVQWLRARELAECPSGPPPGDWGAAGPPVECTEVPPSVTAERPAKAPKKLETKVAEDDLDNMLQCTIIKKPEMGGCVLETDMATQPFFVSSNEELVTDSDATPVITGVCSLADSQLPNPTTNMPKPKSKKTNVNNPMTNVNNPMTYVNKRTTNVPNPTIIFNNPMTNQIRSINSFKNLLIDDDSPTSSTYRGVGLRPDFNKPTTNMTNPTSTYRPFSPTTNMTNPTSTYRPFSPNTNVNRPTTNMTNPQTYRPIRPNTNMTNPQTYRPIRPNTNMTNPQTYRPIRPKNNVNNPMTNMTSKASTGRQIRPTISMTSLTTNVTNPTTNVTNPTTNVTNPTTNTRDPLLEAMRRLQQNPIQGPQLVLTPIVTDGGNMSGGMVSTRGTPLDCTVRAEGSRNDETSLTPAIMSDGQSSTITLVPTQQTILQNILSPPYIVVTPNASLMTSPMTSPMTSAMTSITAQMTPQGVVYLPTLTLTNGQVVTLTAQMMPQVTPPGSLEPPAPRDLLPMSSNLNVIGLKAAPDGGMQVNPVRATGKWVEPGRIQPPSALTFNDFMTPAKFIAKFGLELTIIKLDSAKALWTVAEEYLILAEKDLPSKEPTYWTMGALDNCTQLIWPKQAKTSDPSIVIGSVVGNYQGGKVEDVLVIDSDSDDDDKVTEGNDNQKSKLKVKSFANCERMESVEQKYPDVITQLDRCYKKLTDNPTFYSLMVSVVSSTEECDSLLRERASLHVWHRATGALSVLDVSAPGNILPDTTREALLVRHPDSRFLNDMASKFQQLNSENALVRENQVYVFAPSAGKLLVAPSE